MKTHRYRSVFLSDVHLGTRNCRADFLLDFLCRMRCRNLYLVGDIVDLEAMVARAALDAGYDGHICGHIHFGGIRRIDGVLYCNDGDWVEHCTALTEDEQGWLRLIHWSEQQACVAEAKGDRVMPEAVGAMAFASLAGISPVATQASHFHKAASPS